VTDEELRCLEERLGHRFAEPGRLRQALTHRSTTVPGSHNETLEFLGDAVVGLVVSDLLLQAWPDVDEGLLSKRRAALVNTQSLALRACSLGLDELLALGRGEERSGGRKKASILAGAFEATVGAVYRDGGFGPAYALVQHTFTGDIERPLEDAILEDLGDYKTRLQELAQRIHRTAPAYSVLRVSGPDHARDFECQVEVGGRVLGHGQGTSKKLAEQAAAREAFARLKDSSPGEEQA
jgi:ribonuclease-3